MTSQPSTRERIVTEAIRLFAERGYRGTTVGAIEAAAGLSPRSGGFYKHFKSKEDVLAAGIERHVGEIEAIRPALDLLPLGDLRAELTLVARWALAELGEERPMMRIIQKDGDQFPAFARQYHARVVKRGYDESARVIGRLLADREISNRDPEALGAIALSSLVAYRVEETMFGVPPGGFDEERFIQAWVDVWLTFAQGAASEALAGAEEVAR